MIFFNPSKTLTAMAGAERLFMDPQGGGRGLLDCFKMANSGLANSKLIDLKQ
jgi:hypothetical protein